MYIKYKTKKVNNCCITIKVSAGYVDKKNLKDTCTWQINYKFTCLKVPFSIYYKSNASDLHFYEFVLQTFVDKFYGMTDIV